MLPSKTSPTREEFERAVEGEYRRRFFAAVDEAHAVAAEAGWEELDEEAVSGLLTAAFDAANLRMMIRGRLVAQGHGPSEDAP